MKQIPKFQGSGILKTASKAAKFFQPKALPGFQIKSLMLDSPLVKQVSKDGMLLTKSLQQWIGKSDVSAIDKELLTSILNNHSGEQAINYNQLRREIQGLIPKYSRVPQERYKDYGFNSLGIPDAAQQKEWDELFKNVVEFNPTLTPEEQEAFMVQQFGYRPYNVSFNTFTFESPGITGNTKHYVGNPLGHSRTYTTTNEPDVLHVMESQSDWAQNYKNQHQVFADENAEIDPIFRIPSSTHTSPIQDYMSKNWSTRQIQENLRYAAENGQTRMRYPTPETAAKIEGFQKRVYIPESKEIQDTFNYYKNLQREQLRKMPSWYYDLSIRENSSIWQEFYKDKAKQLFEDFKRSELWEQSPEGQQFLKDLSKIEEERDNYLRSIMKEEFTPQHQTILKKYAEFPKQYQKLFKITPRTLFDNKGNLWYEVDVPEDALTREWQFKLGGKVKQRIK